MSVGSACRQERTKPLATAGNDATGDPHWFATHKTNCLYNSDGAPAIVNVPKADKFLEGKRLIQGSDINDRYPPRAAEGVRPARKALPADLSDAHIVAPAGTSEAKKYGCTTEYTLVVGNAGLPLHCLLVFSSPVLLLVTYRLNLHTKHWARAIPSSVCALQSHGWRHSFIHSLMLHLWHELSLLYCAYTTNALFGVVHMAVQS